MVPIDILRAAALWTKHRQKSMARSDLIDQDAIIQDLSW